MLNTDKWIKYSYLCTDDDSLIEYTCKDTLAVPSAFVSNITCVCGKRALQIGQEDATIQSTNKEKENPMNTIQEVKLMDIDQINAQIESYKTKVNNLQSQVNRIIDNLTTDYWYSDSTDKDEVLSELCDIIQYNPKKEIEFTATIRFNGRIDVDMADVADFSISDALSDAYVDINNGDVVIDNYDLEDVSEQY